MFAFVGFVCFSLCHYWMKLNICLINVVSCVLQTSILALPLSCVVLVEEEGGTFTKR